MKHLRKHSGEQGVDDVDRIVATLLADPSRADDMKSLLRQKLAAPGDVRVALPRRHIAQASPCDIDDMWDNVPV